MSVAWRRLTLAGFGRFENEVEVQFGPGANVLVAPNESGKSTLAAGLTAVLFGLPATANPDEFSQARWRNWNEPPRFEGTLEFSAGGEVYRIRRRFDTHAVTVSRRTDGGWEDVVTGEHNPRARRPNAEYESFLRRTVGVASRDLFTATFAFTQPLPGAARLDEHVQELLTGAGAAQFSRALDALVSEGRRLTKFTKSAGLSPRDAVNDGELEKVQARIDALREALEASRAAVDRSQALQEDISRAQAELSAVRRELEQVEEQIEAWTRWQQLRDQQRAALQQQAQLQRAWDTYRSLEEELKSRRRALQEEFPDLLGAPEGTGQRLEELEQLQSAAEALRRQLAAELTTLRRRAGELLAEWRQFAAERERWWALRDRLRTEFAPFEEAGEEARGFYASYRAAKAALELQAEQVRAELQRREEARAALARERARFAEAYGDLDELGDDAAAAAEERAQLLEERERLVPALDAARRKRQTERRRDMALRAAAAVLGAALAALAPLADPMPVWLLVTGLSLAVLGAVGLLQTARAPVSTPEIEELTARLQAVDDALAAETRLGSYTGLGIPDLRALRERLLARRQAAAAVAEREAAAPPSDQALPARLERAEAELQRFLDLTAPGRERFGDGVERAYEQWAALREEEGRTRLELLSFSRRHFGVESVTPESAPVDGLAAEGIPGAWRALARMLEDAGAAPPRDVGRLVAAVAELDDEHVAKAAAARFEVSPEAEGLTRRTAELAARLEPVLRAAGGDVGGARRRWAEYVRRAAAADMVEKELQGVLAGQGAQSDEELHARALAAANEALDARRRLAELAERHVGLPAPDDDTAPAEVRAAIHRLAARRDELQRRKQDTEERLFQLREQLADVAGRTVINVAEAELELEELEKERARLAREVDVVALAYRELRHAADAFRSAHRDRLARRAGEYWRRFTGRDRRIVLDENFGVQVQDPDGPRHGVSQLSQGARDQLYLALRLAIADLVADDVALPLLLDDPFVNCDDRRLARIREALTALEGTRQIILFSHRDVFAGWGTPVAPAHD